MLQCSSAARMFVMFLLATATVANAAHFQSPVVDTLINDMSLPHEARPSGVPDGVGWELKPRVGMANRVPEGWNAATMWGQIYAARGGSPAVNVRVEVRNPVLLYLSRRDGKWHDLQRQPGVDGAAFREDFVGNENRPPDLRRAKDGSVSVKMETGRNFHFWPAGTGRATIDPADITAMASAFQARIVRGERTLPDDRAKARLLASCGGDYWRSLDAGWKADYSNNGDWAIGRFRFLTPQWQVFTATTLNAAGLRQNPPPLYP